MRLRERDLTDVNLIVRSETEADDGSSVLEENDMGVFHARVLPLASAPERGLRGVRAGDRCEVYLTGACPLGVGDLVRKGAWDLEVLSVKILPSHTELICERL